MWLAPSGVQPGIALQMSLLTFLNTVPLWHAELTQTEQEECLCGQETHTGFDLNKVRASP